MASRGEAREHEAKGNPYHKKHRFAASFCFLFLYFKVLFRSVLPYFVTGWQIVSFKIAALGARALLAMTESVGLIENTERKIQSSDPVKRFLFVD